VSGARTIAPAALRALIASGGEVAILDLREEVAFSESHLLHARALPLSRLELRLAALVPRRTTPIVLCDDADGLAARGAERLASFGYGGVSVLAGGVAAWAAAGFELFSGVNVPSKAFGEFVEHRCGTPHIAAAALHRLLEERADVVVLDSRPFDEFQRVSIPTGIDVPGAELVLRVRDLAPDPATLVVVNCAGRTRSIIGAQSLINAGVPNRVMALENGTMGWSLAGFTPDRGQDRRAPAPSAAARMWAREAAAKVAERCGVQRIDAAALARFQADPARTTYLFDVRDPGEYAAGHLPGAVSAPGGQLVQATDHYVGTLGARLVLVDPLEARALMTASWLRQMGWSDVFVLAAGGSETGFPAPVVQGAPAAPERAIDAAALDALMARGAATVVDLASSRDFRAGHIPGAWFAIRARLERALARVAPQGTLVLTSEDGVIAALAAPEAAALVPLPVRYLAGGTASWKASGRSLEAGEANMADEPIDLWLKPYERARGVKAAMQDYLAWETDLLPRIERDGTCRFRALS
jgi:rhodanese-related sulfurtransferase